MLFLASSLFYFANEWKLFSEEKFRTSTRFEGKADMNSEMACRPLS